MTYAPPAWAATEPAWRRFWELARDDQPRLLRCAVARMTLRQAAPGLGVSWYVLWRWERDRTPSTPAQLRRYVAWLEELTVRHGGPVELASSTPANGEVNHGRHSL